MPDPVSSLLVGPPAVNLARTAPLVPRPVLDLGQHEIALVNAGTTPVTLSSVECDPLRDNETGAVTNARLVATAPTRVDQVIAPDSAVVVRLVGQVPARAGVYSSTLRVRLGSGGTAIPVTVTVAASPLRGIACTLLGLVLAGLINTLQVESDLYAKRTNLIQLSTDNEDWFLRNPVASTQVANLDAYNADMQAALGLLTRRRPWSVVDWRIPMADERRRTAQDELKAIKDAMAHDPPGAAEVVELDMAWKDLQQRLQALSANPVFLAGETPSNLSDQLNAFLTTFRADFLVKPIQTVSDEIGTHVSLVDLTLTAGQRQAARQQAIEVRRWMERAAHDFDLRLVTLANFKLLARSLIMEDAATRRRLADPAVPDDARHSILAELDAAAAQISANTPLPSLQQAYARILAAGTDRTRVQSQVLVQQAQQAAVRASRETDTASVDQVMAQDPPAPQDPPERRTAWVRRVFAAWRPLVASVPDEPTRQDLGDRLDALEAQLAQPDLKAISPPYKAFMQAWSDYALRHLQTVMRDIETPFCRGFNEDLRRMLAETDANMKLVPQSPNLLRWEAKLDQIRVRSSSLVAAECLGVGAHRKEGSFEIEQIKSSPLFDLYGEAIGLAGEVFTAALNATPLPAATRLDVAQNSGVQQAIDLARRLLAGPRPLTVTAVPDEAGRTAERPIQFEIVNLDPAWGAGVVVAIDYGDRTMPDQRSVEELRKKPFVHSYAVPLKASVRVVTATDFQPHSLEAKDQVLAMGALPLEVREAPVWALRLIADEFINARFALALMVALLVYIWQFQAKEPSFGRRGFDYVKAFALGFVVEAAVSNLSGLFQKIVLG